MLPALISAGASIASGLFGKSQADKQAKLQKEFAQKGIQWKVEDARKAGISPIYALGAQTNSYQPVSVGDPVGAFANAGQDIGRAISASSTASDKANAFTIASQRLSLENMELQNKLLASNIAKNNASITPSMPGLDTRYLIDGQGSTAVPGTLVDTSPLARQASAPENPSQEAGAITDVGFTRTANGGYFPVFSKDAKDRSDEDNYFEWAFNIRNRILPMIPYSGYRNPPPVPLKPGHFWSFHPTDGYVQIPYRSKGYSTGGRF